MRRGRPKGDPLELTEQEQFVLDSYLQGHKVADIAEQINVSKDRVYRIARKARKKLKARERATLETDTQRRD